MEKKIELTPEEIEKILVQAFNEGYNAGQYHLSASLIAPPNDVKMALGDMLNSYEGDTIAGRSKRELLEWVITPEGHEALSLAYIQLCQGLKTQAIKIVNDNRDTEEVKNLNRAVALKMIDMIDSVRPGDTHYTNHWNNGTF